MIEAGKKAPDFTLKDQNGTIHVLSRNRGTYVLVYFYPKDDTPGCTIEACAIRDLNVVFIRNEIKVFGVSADTSESHKAFAEKYSLPFTLLSDPEQEVIKAYDAKDTISTKRISYLIGPLGNIVKNYPDVDPVHHAEEILKDVLAFKNK